MRQLFPAPDGSSDEVDLDTLYGVVRPQLADRPWVGVCMIASLDGSIAVGGHSGGLGNTNDTAVMRALRRAAEVVLIGAGNAEAEHYRPASKPGQRIGVVTASGRVDTSTDLFTSGCGFLVMPTDGPAAPTGIDVLRAGTGAVDLSTALARLGEMVDHPNFVQAEGGARLNGALLDAGCVDELDLSIAPALVGGTGSRLVVGATELVRRYTPAHILADDDGYLFTRWVKP